VYHEPAGPYYTLRRVIRTVILKSLITFLPKYFNVRKFDDGRYNVF